MSRIALSAALVVFGWLSPAFAAGEGLAAGMSALREGNWAAARLEARRDGAIAHDVILWHKLRAGQGDAPAVMDFLARHPDWPGLPFLREKSEVAMAAATPQQIRTFFEAQPPRTGAGALALADALARTSEQGAAQATAVLAWRTLRMSSDEHDQMLARWGDVLRPHHTARLDHALWNGWSRDARRMVPLVPEDWQKLAEARLSLRADEGGFDARIEAVPASLKDHPGLAYERFRWRLSKGRLDDAIELLLERSTSVAALGEPWAWGRARRDLARDRMRDGAVLEAYEIASRHGLVEGNDFADLEWLSGFLALRFLDRADLALAHFQRFEAAVFTPISLGRAGYWKGRAHEALGQTDAAQAAYAEGARFQTSFYGLLAAERGGIAPDPKLAGDEAFSDWRRADFTKSSVFEAAMLLLSAGEDVLGERFLTHLAESLNREQIGQMGDMLADMQRPHIGVMLGKRAAQAGIEIPGPYYALHPKVVATEYPVPKELVLAIARRESEFDPVVISHAGARGFMQLMPGTAREVAGQLDLPYDEDRLLSDPAYNATLGSTYLAGLADQFDGNAVMMAAGYNAGPSRPVSWMNRFGDPRQGRVDVIDWIEFIPFDETRNYVMRVTESLPVYRARLGLNPHPVPFSRELTGSTLNRRPIEGE